MKGGITPTPVTPAAGESILKPRFRRDALSPADKSMTKLITLGDIFVKCCFGDRVFLTHWTMAILSNATVNFLQNAIVSKHIIFTLLDGRLRSDRPRCSPWSLLC